MISKIEVHKIHALSSVVGSLQRPRDDDNGTTLHSLERESEKKKTASTMTRLVAVVVSLLAISAVTAGPGKPQITVGLNTELLDKGLLNALEPTIQWETSGSLPNGAEIEVRTI